MKVKEGREAVHRRVREIREGCGRLEVREGREVAGGWKSEKVREAAAAGIRDGWGISAAARGAMAAG